MIEYLDCVVLDCTRTSKISHTRLLKYLVALVILSTPFFTDTFSGKKTFPDRNGCCKRREQEGKEDDH